MKRNLKTRGLIFLLTFLLLAAVCSPALLTTAAAEGEITTLTNDVTGIEVDVETDALPTNAVLYVSVSHRIQFELNPGGVADYLDQSLYWQPIVIRVRGDTDYSGSATARIPLTGAVDSTIDVDSVKEVLMPPDPSLPDAGLVDAPFTVAADVLTVTLDIPATVYVGVTDPNVRIPVPGDEIEPGHDIGPSWDEMRDDFFDWFGDLFPESGSTFNTFLQSDWTSSYSSAILDVVNDLYKVVYPFGIFIMLIAWIFNIGVSGFTMTLDPTNKYSILRALMQLFVGLILLTVTPELLMLIFSLGNQLKNLVVGTVQATSNHSFIQAIFQLKIYLNLAFIAVLQCVSPLFIGTVSGNEPTRRFTVNFLKEYGLRCMELALVTLYILIVDRLENIFNWSAPGMDLLLTIVLSISVFTIDKKFEKLFH